MPSVTQKWTHELPYMQQSVLLSALRNEDGIAKGDPAKPLIKWFRRCVVVSAFDGISLAHPSTPGGGNYTGPIDDASKAADDFLRARDRMSFHYFGHAMHAFQILGYKHPNPDVRFFWYDLYHRMVDVMHCHPETMDEMDRRLSDGEEAWKARSDQAEITTA